MQDHVPVMVMGATGFTWARTADKSLAKAVRKDRAISESRHY
jgi:hypothetical protein